jgi:hypothetical protein
VALGERCVHDMSLATWTAWHVLVVWAAPLLWWFVLVQGLGCPCDSGSVVGLRTKVLPDSVDTVNPMPMLIDGRPNLVQA